MEGEKVEREGDGGREGGREGGRKRRRGGGSLSVLVNCTALLG